MYRPRIKVILELNALSSYLVRNKSDQFKQLHMYQKL